MSKEILSETPMSMVETKQEIKRIKKRDKELNFRGNKVEEYLDVFTKSTQKDSEELIKALKKLDVPRLKDIHVIKITDLLPETVDDLKILLQGYTVTVNKDNMAKIVSTVKKYLPSKK